MIACFQILHTVFPHIVSSLEYFPPLNSFPTLVRKLFKFSLHKRKTNAETIWIFQGFTISKKNSCRGNYMRKYGTYFAKGLYCQYFLSERIPLLELEFIEEFNVWLSPVFTSLLDRNILMFLPLFLSSLQTFESYGSFLVILSSTKLLTRAKVL